MTPRREVSVLTAAFEPRGDYLLAAYESLADGNREADWRWILQIDGEDPVDLPEAIKADHRVEVVRNGRRLGAAATRNLALTRATSDLVQNLDSDDYLLEGALADLSSALVEEPTAALAFGRDLELAEDGRTFEYQGGFEPGLIPAGAVYERWRQMPFPPIHPAGVMWRRQVLLAYGGWAALPAGEDTAILVAATQHHPCVFIDRETFVYRRHPAQISVSDEFLAIEQEKRAFIQARADALVGGRPLWVP